MHFFFSELCSFFELDILSSLKHPRRSLAPTCSAFVFCTIELVRTTVIHSYVIVLTGTISSLCSPAHNHGKTTYTAIQKFLHTQFFISYSASVISNKNSISFLLIYCIHYIPISTYQSTNSIRNNKNTQNQQKWNKTVFS